MFVQIVPSFAGPVSSGCYSSAVLLLCWSCWLSLAGCRSGSVELSGPGLCCGPALSIWPALEDGPGVAGRFSSSVARAGAACMMIGRLQWGQNIKALAPAVRPCFCASFHAARAASGAGCNRTKGGTASAAAILSTLASCAAPVLCLYNVCRVIFSRSARSANDRPRALQMVFIFSFISMLANVVYLFDLCKMSPGGPGAAGPGPWF